MDPAALGTLRIGLDAIAAETRLEPHQTRRPATRRRPAGLRLAVARALRRTADVLEPRVFREAHP